MYWRDVYDSIVDSVWIPDPNEVLDRRNLNPIWEAIKSNFSNIDLIDLDDQDISNLMNWYNNYKIAYSYPELNHKYSNKWQWILEKQSIEKWKSDIMWLVEISIWRLLQYIFEMNWGNVRVRKTTNHDDVMSWLDYIVEFYEEDWGIKKFLWIDFTVSEEWALSLYKNQKKESSPDDYNSYYRKKYNKKIGVIPRIVMSLDKDLAYSFTNNFFITVLEKWWLLDDEDIEMNIEYSKQDINKSKKSGIEFKVSMVIENEINGVKNKVEPLINNFKKNVR